MKTKRLFISLTLGLGLTLALLWLLSGQSEVVLAQAGSGIIRVAPPPVGDDAPTCGGETNPCRTVQYAVDQAQAGEEIRVASGVYTGVQNVSSLNTGTFTATQVVVITKTLTLRGGYTTTNWTTPYPIAQPTTLNAQGQGRVLFITGHISPTIEGLCITGGDAAGLGGAPWGNDAGGGVYGVNATSTLSNNQVFSNTADYGGGLYLNASDATLNGNTVTSNTADSDGGGLYLEDSHATLNSDTVSGNTADYGGGLYLNASDATLSGNTVTSNTVSFRGGGLYLEDSDDASLSGNTITSNTASFRGGGLSLNGSAATLSGNTIAFNTASFRGGGLYLEDSDATLSENTISDNTASFRGGGLYLKDSADATLSENTVISNTADYAGGLYLEDSAATLSGNTISDNTASSGGGLYLDTSAATLSGNTVSDNTANYDGGGLYLEDSGATLSGNTVTSNAADSGGGLYLEWSNATLTNNVVADNQANTAGSGLYMWASSPRLLHTTIARNSGGDGSGVVVDAMQIVGYQTAALTNTILVSHTVGITVTDGNKAILESTLWGSGAWANLADTGGAGTIITGTRNYWDDPTFVDPGAGDYHISPGSAAIDVGVYAGVTVDIDGESRPAGTGYDLGADEFPAALRVTKEADQMVVSGSDVTFTITITNTGYMDLSNVAVTDAETPGCVQTVGDLDVGISTTYTCTRPSVTADFTNTATVTGTSPAGTVTDTDTALVDIISPTIEIDKAPHMQTVVSGSDVTFTLTLTNTGDVTLTTVTVSDTVATNCAQEIGDLAAGISTTYTCTRPNVTADFTNTATVTGTPPVGPDVTDTDTALVDIISPTIEIDKAPHMQTVVSGSDVTFTLTLTNTGDVTLTTVTVSDTVATNCAQEIGDLAAGISTTYTCTRPSVTADFTNTATVTGTPPVGPGVTDTDTALVDVISPTIEIDKAPDMQMVISGSDVTFTLTLTNTGDVTLTTVTVSDTVATNCAQEIGDLAAGISTTYTCTRPSVTADFTNTAIVTGTPPVGPGVTDTDMALVDVISPTIEIDKAPDMQMVVSGSDVTFTLTVTNTGDVPLTPVTVTDALAPDCERTFVSLGVGASESYTCTRLNVTADFTNTATVTGTPPVGAVVTDTDTALVNVISPTIEIYKAPESQPVQSGDAVTFTITVTNTGDVPLTPVTVTDALAPNCERTFVSLGVGASESYTCTRLNVTADFTNTATVTGTPPVGAVVTDIETALVYIINPAIEIAKAPESQSVQSGDTVTFTITVTNTGDVSLAPVTVTDALAPDCERTFVRLGVRASESYTCTRLNVTADFTNTATVTGTPPVGNVVTDTATALVEVINPDIEIAKTPDIQTVVSGSTVIFTITVVNTGDAALSDVTVTDVQAPNCERTFVSLGVGASESYTCTRPSVTADFTNTATVTGTSPAGTVTDTDTATVLVEEAIEGLTATNDSPTPLGSATTLTATITGGSNVVYTWAFGHDGATGSGAVVTHTYPDVGVYTAIVTASNSVSVLTATTPVTITDALIEGLVANNDSPTVLGQATTLTATITGGSNVVYTWALGDGDTGSGAVVAHTYPATGTYTAVVTASNSASVVPATTTVTIIEAFELYLPVILKNYTPPSVPPTETPTPTATGTLPPTDTPTPTAKPPPTGPDLVVTDISVVPNPPEAGQSATVYVTVKNQGNQAVPYGNNFYVDFYVDREPAPLLRGDIEWGVQFSWFGAGESYTLNGSYAFTEGTHQLWGQADTDNTVVETNENNNVLGPMTLDVTSLGGGEAPTGPVIIPTPGAGSPRPTPSPAP